MSRSLASSVVAIGYSDGWGIRYRKARERQAVVLFFLFSFFFEEKGFTGQGHAETNLDKPT
jgi:hypothetical protein